MKKLNAQSALPFVLLAVYALLILTRLIPAEVMDSTVKLFFALIILELLVFALPVFLYSRMQERDYIKELPFHFFSTKFLYFLRELQAAFNFLSVNFKYFVTRLNTALLSRTNYISRLIFKTGKVNHQHSVGI